MTRSSKVVLYFMGALDELIEHGLASAKCRISAQGMKTYRRLVADGFEPTHQEMAECTAAMMKDPRVMATFKQPATC